MVAGVRLVDGAASKVDVQTSLTLWIDSLIM
jgi:hypothetical protein